MPHPDETFIVRVRPAEGDAVVEEVRSRKRLHVRDLSQISALIVEWTGRDRGDDGDGDEQREPEEGGRFIT